jgi:hypothetical protein
MIPIDREEEVDPIFSIAAAPATAAERSSNFGCYRANLTTWLMDGEAPRSVTALTMHLQPDLYPHVDDEAEIIPYLQERRRMFMAVPDTRRQSIPSESKFVKPRNPKAR